MTDPARDNPPQPTRITQSKPDHPQTTRTTMPELKDRLNFAVQAATEAGQLTLRYFRSSDLTIETKPDDTPVTRADKESEETLRAHLAKEFPNDAIVGEEFGTQSGSTDYTWYLDPIDGTKSFIRGIPLYGTMMGLEHRDEAVAGIIVFPALNEIIYAAKDHGAWWSDQLDPIAPKQARVSNISRLADAYFTTTSSSSFWEIDKGAAYRRLTESATASRGLPDCYGHYLVATGRCEIMIDAVMNVYDNAPLQSIIQEAGGTFTDLKGNPTIHGGNAVSTNGRLHDQVLEILNS